MPKSPKVICDLNYANSGVCETMYAVPGDVRRGHCSHHGDAGVTDHYRQFANEDVSTYKMADNRAEMEGQFHSVVELIHRFFLVSLTNVYYVHCFFLFLHVWWLKHPYVHYMVTSDLSVIEISILFRNSAQCFVGQLSQLAVNCPFSPLTK